MKKQLIATVLCCSTMLSSTVACAATMSPTATPMTTVSASPDASSDPLFISGKPGDIFTSGDMVFEIVPYDASEEVISSPTPRVSTRRWSISLSGDAMSKEIEITASLPYAKVNINNTSSSHIVFTITQGSPSGDVVKGTNVTIDGKTSINVYSTNKWPAGWYYANFTSGKANMKGTSSCRVASTKDELDL